MMDVKRFVAHPDTASANQRPHNGSSQAPSTGVPKLEKSERETDYHVRAVDRVLAILEELGDESGAFGDVAMAERLGLHKSTVHRLLAVLRQKGFVEREPGGTMYVLGWRVFELGMAAASRLDVLQLAKPHVRQLVEATGETSNFGVLRQGEVVSLVNADSLYTVRTPSTIGRHIPLHCTSQAKAILAFLPPDQVAHQLEGYVFSRHSANTILSKKRFLAELALVATRGYAVDNEEYEEGLRCIAAPVRDHSGDVVGAIGIAGPTFRVTGSRLPALAREVMRVADELSTAMGYRGGSTASGSALSPGPERRPEDLRRKLVSKQRSRRGRER